MWRVKERRRALSGVQKCRDTRTSAPARSLCMNEYDRNIVSLLSKLFKKERQEVVCQYMSDV